MGRTGLAISSRAIEHDIRDVHAAARLLSQNTNAGERRVEAVAIKERRVGRDRTTLRATISPPLSLVGSSSQRSARRRRRSHADAAISSTSLFIATLLSPRLLQPTRSSTTARAAKCARARRLCATTPTLPQASLRRSPGAEVAKDQVVTRRIYGGTREPRVPPQLCPVGPE